MESALRPVWDVLRAVNGMSTNSVLQEFFVAGGTLWGEAPSYIVRPADEELYRLTLSGEYCNVLAARQMGKSSLMVRVSNRLQEAGVTTAILDISILGGGFSTPEAWFFGFIDELAVQLGLDVDVDAWWEAHANHNPVQRFSNFLRDVVLVEIQKPIAIFVDEIDSALGIAFTDDFFAAIRAAYNGRASQAEFKRLTFILLGVARPADLILDRNRTPYNIGTHIHLSDFTLSELDPFQSVFETFYPGQGTEIVAWVMDWTNGQPYLTQKLCGELIHDLKDDCSQERVNQSVKRLFFSEEARKESNLRAILDRIESSPRKVKMLQLYGQILDGQAVADEERSPAKTELKLTGLVHRSALGNLEVRNRIYQTVFDPDWVRKNLPAAQTRQLTILVSLLAILAFIIAGYALYQQQKQPSLTYAEQFQTSNSPDVKLTSLARLLELDSRPNSQAYELYSSLSHQEKLSLFTELSSPQNVAEELVTLIEAVYQENENTPAGNEMLGAMRSGAGANRRSRRAGLENRNRILAQGATGSQPQSKRADGSQFLRQRLGGERHTRPPELRRALRPGDGADRHQKPTRPPSTIYKRSGIRTRPARRRSAAAIQANPALAYTIYQNPVASRDLLAFITPVTASATPEATRNLNRSPTPPPSPLAAQNPSPSPVATQEQPSPYAGWIAFGYGEGNRREIYIMNPATGLRQQITNNGFIDESPSFSPDNWKLVYASNRSQGGWELYAYDLKKGTEQQLTSFDGQARFPVWSREPGDTRIVFEGRTFDTATIINLWMVDSASGELTQLTSSGADSRPAWSPDGSKIVFGRPTADTNGDGRITANDISDIYTLDLNTMEERKLTDTPAFNDFNFAWSPDGEWIAFTSVRFDANGDGAINLSDSQDLYLIPADGSGQNSEQHLSVEAGPVFSPSWSPDGRFILVLITFSEGQSAIWRYDTRSGNIARITETGPYYQPAYSKPAISISTP